MIRTITEKDRELLLAMMEEFYHSAAVLHSIPHEYMQNTFCELMKDNPYVKGYLIEQDGIPAGYALLALTYSNEAGGLAVWVEELFLREQFREQGLGKEFFAFLKQEYPSARRFRLEATRENTGAVRLYRKLGYEELDYLQLTLDCPDVK